MTPDILVYLLSLWPQCCVIGIWDGIRRLKVILLFNLSQESPSPKGKKRTQLRCDHSKINFETLLTKKGCSKTPNHKRDVQNTFVSLTAPKEKEKKTKRDNKKTTLI